MVFERSEGGSERRKIFAVWMHAKLIECGDDVKLRKVSASDDASKRLLDKRYRIAVPNRKGVEFPIVNAESETSIVFLDE